jgi:hypothetical protein
MEAPRRLRWAPRWIRRRVPHRRTTGNQLGTRAQRPGFPFGSAEARRSTLSAACPAGDEAGVTARRRALLLGPILSWKAASARIDACALCAQLRSLGRD